MIVSARNGSQTHVLTDEVLELVGVNLTETFKSCYLSIATETLDCSDAFLVGVAIECVLFSVFIIGKDSKPNSEQ